MMGIFRGKRRPAMKNAAGARDNGRRILHNHKIDGRRIATMLSEREYVAEVVRSGDSAGF